MGYKTAARTKSPAITTIENDKRDAADIIYFRIYLCFPLREDLLIFVIVHENRLSGTGFGRFKQYIAGRFFPFLL